MKTSSTALLATMAAASTPAAWAATLRTSGESDARKESSNVATTSSGSERRLSGKSGKSTKALGLATYEDYKWIEGLYTVKDPDTTVFNIEGEPFNPDPRPKGTELTIESMFGSEGLAFQAFHYFDNGVDFYAREILEGVASYNTDFINEVDFYTDHIEVLNSTDGNWNTLPNADVSEVTHLRCSKLANVPSGRSIVCDAYGNDYFFNVPGVGDVHIESMYSTVWTDVTDESS